MGTVSASGRHAPSRRFAALLLRMLAVTAGAVLIWRDVISLTDQLVGTEMSLTKHIANAVCIFVLTVPLILALRRFVDQLPVTTLGLRTDRSAWSSLGLGATTWLLPAAAGLGACPGRS